MKHYIALLLLTIVVASGNAVSQQLEPWPREDQSPAAKPSDVPQRWHELTGEYGTEREPVYLLERGLRLWILIGRDEAKRLDEVSANLFRVDGRRLSVARDAQGRVTAIGLGDVSYERRQVGPAGGAAQLRIDPIRPVSEVIQEALATEPPKESGEHRPPDLIEIVKLDPTIHLDIRYASTNNFLSSVFYSEPRAFAQRPAAEALVRVSRRLKSDGYGLLVHDGYRPWYVTKAFWDATPDDKKWLVANPAAGSRHNRGCAIDLTLYELKSGRVVEMPSTYDESTPRAYAFYPGGTDLQRWHRALLRRLMESEGFTVNPQEWWHFDYKDWQQYGISNVRFDRLRL